LAFRLLARIVSLALAVFFTWGSDLDEMGHFLADILNGDDRLGDGKRYRYSGTPSEAARYRAGSSAAVSGSGQHTASTAHSLSCVSQ
jgi:hypothetical protein